MLEACSENIGVVSPEISSTKVGCGCSSADVARGRTAVEMELNQIASIYLDMRFFVPNDRTRL